MSRRFFNVAVGVGLGVVLAAVLAVVLLEHAGGSVDRSTAEQPAPGTHAFPMPVAAGARFAIGEVEYQDGWEISDFTQTWTVDKLQATNNGTSVTTVTIMFQASPSDTPDRVECTATLQPGATTELSCLLAPGPAPQSLTVQNAH